MEAVSTTISTPVIGEASSTTTHDFEQPRLDIQGFVVDFFTWRIAKDGNEWHERPELPFGVQPEHIAMRKLATIFERRHADELKQFALELLEDENLSFSRYCDILEEFGRIEHEDPMGMSFGRLVGLIAFGGVVATQMTSHGQRRQVHQIALYTSRFIDARIRITWPVDGRTWAQFMLMSTDICRRDEQARAEVARRQSRRWSLIVGAAIVGVGAIIGTKALLTK